MSNNDQEIKEVSQHSPVVFSWLVQGAAVGGVLYLMVLLGGVSITERLGVEESSSLLFLLGIATFVTIVATNSYIQLRASIAHLVNK